MVSILGCKVDYEYLFKNGEEFELPKFPINITLESREDLVRILADFARQTYRRGGIDDEFCKNLVYLLRNLDYFKKWTRQNDFIEEVVRASGVHEKSSRTTAELFVGFCWRKLASEPSRNFTEIVCENARILRKYATDLPLLKVGSATRYEELRDIYPCYFNGDSLWDDYAEDAETDIKDADVRAKTPYAIFSIAEQVRSFMEAKRQDLAEELIRRTFYDKLSVEELKDELTVAKFFNIPDVKEFFPTKAHIARIFSKDYKGAFSGSPIGRALYMASASKQIGIGTLGKSKLELSVTTDFVNRQKLQKLIKSEGEEAYEEITRLVNELDKPELLFFELAAIRGDAWFKYGSYAEAMSMKDCKAKMRLVNTIVGSKICVNGTMSARQAAMHYLPIFVNGDEKEERGYCKVFSNEYRSIHGCDAWEFYGGLRDFFRKQKTPLLIS